MSVFPIDRRVKVESPGALAASIAALVGFVPTDSFVVVCLSGGVVQVTMRMDLDDPIEYVGRQIEKTADIADVDSVVVVVYTSPKQWGLPLLEGVQVLCDFLTGCGLLVRDALHVNGERYWSYLCASDSCCPSAGTPVSVETPVLVAEGVTAGVPIPASSRDDLKARYEPRPELAPSPEAFKQARLLLPMDVRAKAELAWQTLQDLSGEMPCAETVLEVKQALLVIAMSNIQVRDFVLGSMASVDVCRPLVHTLVYSALTAPEEWRETLAGAASMALAFSGESSIAVQCLVELAGNQTLAKLVKHAVGIPIPPESMREVMVKALPLVFEKVEHQQRSITGGVA